MKGSEKEEIGIVFGVELAGELDWSGWSLEVD